MTSNHSDAFENSLCRGGGVAGLGEPAVVGGLQEEALTPGLCSATSRVAGGTASAMPRRGRGRLRKAACAPPAVEENHYWCLLPRVFTRQSRRKLRKARRARRWRGRLAGVVWPSGACRGGITNWLSVANGGRAVFVGSLGQTAVPALTLFEPSPRPDARGRRGAASGAHVPEPGVSPQRRGLRRAQYQSRVQVATARVILTQVPNVIQRRRASPP